jgi:HAE1 family hydrophobic/amphiphilic exporter-1
VNKTKMERQIQKMVNKLTDLPKDFTVKLVGEKEEVREAFTKLFFALFLAVILVYMIMASQFESLMQPFFIMFTVPLSLIGVIFALLLTGTPLSIIALLGVIILGGVVVNNGIVLVDFSNMRMKQGASAEEAAEIASRVRARPILMSASTTLVGLIPLALGLGEGAELRSPMARAVMGGLLISTLLTLFVMPALYILNERIFHKEQSPEVHELKEKVRFQLHHIFSLFVPWVSTKLKGLFNKRRKDSAS